MFSVNNIRRNLNLYKVNLDCNMCTCTCKAFGDVLYLKEAASHQKIKRLHN